MEKKSNQPDQYNSKSKMKFVTNDSYTAPLFRNICDFQHTGNMYSADGSFSQKKLDMNTEYTKNSKKNLDEGLVSDVDNDFDSQYFPGFTTVHTQGNGCIMEGEEDEVDEEKYNKTQKSNRGLKCSEKRRYINHGDYVPGASMQVGGFGNLDNFATQKFGVATRNDHATVSDMEIDRFHFTYRNYQHEHLGSNPLPEDTRHHNKQFN